MPIIHDLSGGRNGIDHPASPDFPDNQCAEAVNVHWRRGGVAQKRNGSYDVMANTTGDGFTTPIVAMFRHSPSSDENATEVWAIEEANPGNMHKLAAGSSAWGATVSAGIMWSSAAEIKKTEAVSFNGKLYMLYADSSGPSVDRMKVYDSTLDVIRWVGMRTPAAPTVANTGVGAYAATIRYYRVRYYDLNTAGVIVRMSEPSPSTSFTPSGAGTAARVTKPAALGINENEEYWLLEASPDNVSWYRLAAMAVSTTTHDNSSAVSAYANGYLSEISGWFTYVPSARYAVTDGNRLIFANFIEQGLSARVGWTPVLGTGDGDSERIFQTATIKPFTDLDEKNGGGITGLGQIDGVIYAFKATQIWRLLPTDNLARPYIARRVSGVVGCISNRSIALGEDAWGNPCLYFMSNKGPYRVGPSSGLEYIGRDLEDLTRAVDGSITLKTDAEVVAHSVFHRDQNEWWLWVTLIDAQHAGATTPNYLFTLNVKKATRKDSYGVRGGWSRHVQIDDAYCSCLGHIVTGAASASVHTNPWIAPNNVNSKIYICDIAGSNTDALGSFSSYVTTKSLTPVGKKYRTGDINVLASHRDGASISLTVGVAALDQSDSGTVTMSSIEIGSVVIKKVESVSIADASIVQVTIGDVALSVTDLWTVRELHIPIFEDGDL